METPKQMIGAPLPRPVGYRLATGRGTFTDNISLPRMAQIAFVRSPYAHALIKSIDTTEADKVEGVIRIITGTDVAKICKPFILNKTISYVQYDNSTKSGSFDYKRFLKLYYNFFYSYLQV